MSGGNISLGDHVLPAPHLLSTSAFRDAEQMLGLSELVPGAVSHAGVFLYIGVSDPSLYR